MYLANNVYVMYINNNNTVSITGVSVPRFFFESKKKFEKGRTVCFHFGNLFVSQFGNLFLPSIQKF